MADDIEVFFECVICHGEQERERRSDGSSICAHERCKREYAKRRRDGTNSGDQPPLVEKALAAPPKKCRKIKDVLGVSLCLTSELSSDEKRTGRTFSNDDIQCEVRGGFGDARDKVEDLIPDTRWVKLSDLVDAMDKGQLKKLFTFAGQLKSLLERAEEGHREAQDD
jgi:hypothetical protein